MNTLETLLAQLIEAIEHLQDDIHVIRETVAPDVTELVELHSREEEKLTLVLE